MVTIDYIVVAIYFALILFVGQQNSQLRLQIFKYMGIRLKLVLMASFQRNTLRKKL